MLKRITWILQGFQPIDNPENNTYYSPVVNAASDQHQTRSTLGIIVDGKFEYFAFEFDRNIDNSLYSHFKLYQGDWERKSDDGRILSRTECQGMNDWTSALRGMSDMDSKSIKGVFQGRNVRKSGAVH